MYSVISYGPCRICRRGFFSRNYFYNSMNFPNKYGRTAVRMQAHITIFLRMVKADARMNFSYRRLVSVYKSARGFNGRQRHNSRVKAACRGSRYICTSLPCPYAARPLKLSGLARKKFLRFKAHTRRRCGSYGKRMQNVNAENFFLRGMRAM